MIKCERFGQIGDREIRKYTLFNEDFRVELLNYGGIIKSIFVRNNYGQFSDVVLGYDTLEEYMNNDGYLGALIGRVGNRIGKASFELNGQTYEVGKNDGNNSLHGGIKGFNAKVWDDKVEGDQLILKYVSVDGEEGYPGTMTTIVKYSIEQTDLTIEYSATCDQDTPVNLTNHVYFNLAGQGNGNILDTKLCLKASGITATDSELIPTGEIIPVEGTPYDFNKMKAIGKDINVENEQLSFGNGYDINYVLDGKGFRKIATAVNEKSNVKLSVFTDAIGVQFYTGNFLSGVKGKNNTTYGFREGFCLETQGFPNAVNIPSFPSCILKVGETFTTNTVYSFKK